VVQTAVAPMTYLLKDRNGTYYFGMLFGAAAIDFSVTSPELAAMDFGWTLRPAPESQSVFPG
jgi:hypothetical protein